MAITADHDLELPETARDRSHVLVTWGLPVAQLERRLAQLGLTDAGVRAEVLGDDGRAVRVRVSAADRGRLDWGVALTRARLGDLVVGDDGSTLEGEVIALLRRQGLTVGTAESLTSGLLASRLSEPPGASDAFAGGVVSYASAVKFEVLDVREGPVVTAEAARQMAEGVALVLDVESAVSLTGVAGPAEMEGQPVGTVFVGSWLDGEADHVELSLSGDRDAIRTASASHALDHLRRRLLDRERRLASRRPG